MATVEEKDPESISSNQTVNPSIIWKLSSQTHEYILRHLDNELLPYLDETARFAFVFAHLPEDIFNTIYDITIANQFAHHIMRGHEKFGELGR